VGADVSTTVVGNGHKTGIAKLTVYHLGKLVLTESALTGEVLEGRPDTEKFESTDPAVIAEVLASIERAKPKPADGECDARWGLVFSDASDTRVRTLYLNAFGTRGVLDGAPVAFADDSLVQYLRGKYGEDFVLS
jgi:hypothetical protein